MITTFNTRILGSIAVSSLLCIACGLTSCTENAASQSFEAKLRAAIQESSQEETKSFAMETLTDFTWDGLYIFGPYTPASEIEKALGFPWPPAKESGIELSDTFCLLVFTHKGRVIRYYEFPRRDGDWSALSSMTKISPESAEFSARKHNGGTVVTMAGENKD